MTASKNYESALLGATITEPSLLDKHTDLRGTDFLDPDLGALWEALLVIREAGLPFSAYDICRELQSMHVPETVRTPKFIGNLLHQGVVAHAGHYHDEIVKASILRRMASLGREVVRRAEQGTEDPQMLRDWFEGAVRALQHDFQTSVISVAKAAQKTVEQLQSAKNSKPGITTGIYEADDAFGVWRPGELMILAARPSVGKTALAMQIAEHNARCNRPVLFVSLEMTARELLTRMLCARGNVDNRHVRAGDLQEQELQRLELAATGMDCWPLRIWSPTWMDMNRLRGIAKVENSKEPLSLIVVDYVGLIRPHDQRRPRHEQVAEISRDLKQLSQELNCVVLALCQLNRNAEAEEPRLSHLRESGAIEQDADSVWFLFRKEEYSWSTYLACAKNRHGPIGKTLLTLQPQQMRFVSATKDFDSD